MTLHRLFQSLDIIIDAGLSAVEDHDARLEVLDYQRGIKSTLASLIQTPPDNVIPFENAVLSRRLATALAETRRNQVAVAARMHNTIRIGFDDWEIHDDID